MLNKQKGLVIDYDGYMGVIKTLDKEYLLLKKNVIDNKEIKIGDNVTFIGEEVSLINDTKYIATFVNVV